MKKMLVPLMLFLSLTLVACSSPVTAAELKSDKPRAASPEVTQAELAALVEGNSAFAWSLYQQLKTQDGNLFYSPYSLSLALAMTYAGARNETEQEMATTLHFTLPQEKLHQAFNYLALELLKRETIKDAEGKDDAGFRLDIVNDIWGQKDYDFLAPFLDALAENYGAGLRILDFIKDAEGARETINQYISDRTEGRIKDLIPQGAIDSLTRLVLTNAIYFNAAWASPFDKDETQDGAFYLLDGSQVTAAMMHQSETTGYAEGADYQVVELPYAGGQLSMVVIMPKEGQFATFESSLDAARVSSIIDSLKTSVVDLSLPKFEFDASFDLVQELTAMGMPIAFTDQADFSGITGNRDLCIGDVMHKGFISVDEAGTEAAAASAVIMGLTGMPSEQATMTVNHPFIFLIRDIPTSTVLFIGRVVNPLG
jgi:serpin B